MKILYIAPENVVGNLNTWKYIHEQRGNKCRYVTYFPSQFGFPDDICLNLPWVAPTDWFLKLRENVYKHGGGPQSDVELKGSPPEWQPGNILISSFFKLRDQLWRLWIEPAIRKYDLLDFDVYHLETGLGFYRNGSFVKRVSRLHRPVFNTFHGIELRHRGVVPAIDRLTIMNFTSELDLLEKHPNLKYLYLPYDVKKVKVKDTVNNPITICHATRNRYFKGSDRIIEVCEKLQENEGIRFILIENLPHDKAMQLKSQADIYIDQISNVAPGYGMNSIEAMSMGQVSFTFMDDQYQAFMPDHPFVHATPDTLESELQKLIQFPDRILELGQTARKWTEDHHSLKAVGDQLYEYYNTFGVLR